MTRIDEIREREKNATKGPWEHGAPSRMTFEEMRSEYARTLKNTLDHFGGDILNQVHGVYEQGSEVRVCITGISPHSPDNADFICNAREDIPYLLAEIKRLNDNEFQGELAIAELKARLDAEVRRLQNLEVFNEACRDRAIERDAEQYAVVCQENASLRAEVERLKEGLKRYCCHEYRCAHGPIDSCTCGLSKLLKESVK